MLDFNINSVGSGQCFISDEEWLMILESGAYIQTGNVYHAILKKNVLTFKITNVGNVELLGKQKVPCARYKLPLIDKTLNFRQRVNAYLETDRLARGEILDDEYYLIYGT